VLKADKSPKERRMAGRKGQRITPNECSSNRCSCVARKPFDRAPELVVLGKPVRSRCDSPSVSPTKLSCIRWATLRPSPTPRTVSFPSSAWRRCMWQTRKRDRRRKSTNVLTRPHATPGPRLSVGLQAEHQCRRGFFANRPEVQRLCSTLPKSVVRNLDYCARDKRRVLISHGFMWNRMVVPSPTDPTPTSSSKVVSEARTRRGS